ncbi:hypothetical protein C8J56DRAFT_910027 [Mycena floridula]|nr:hypothetical protein C8J56DRAFT_910027 [Mycena floridula]
MLICPLTLLRRQTAITGSSVLALECNDGLMMAADTLASYSSLARFKDVDRLYRNLEGLGRQRFHEWSSQVCSLLQFLFAPNLIFHFSGHVDPPL